MVDIEKVEKELMVDALSAAYCAVAPKNQSVVVGPSGKGEAWSYRRINSLAMLTAGRHEEIKLQKSEFQ